MTAIGGMVIGGLAVGLAGALYYSPHLLRLRQVRRLDKLCRATRSIVLTYDDGPGSVLTPRLLDLLARYDARASFFLLGSRARDAGDVVGAAASAGHELGCHSDTHISAWRVSPWRALSDMNRGYTALAEWVSPNAPYRPPEGKLTLPTWWRLRRRGTPVAWWTLDSGDTRRVHATPAGIAQQVRELGGAVVLMHDFDRPPEHQPWAEHMLMTTEQLLKLARDEGFTLRTWSELQECRP